MYILNKVFAIILFSLTIPFCLVYGQESENSNPLQSGTKALQFQISDNFTLGSFAGSAISYKYQVSEDRARRIGISLNNSFTVRDLPESELDFTDNRLDLNLGIEYTWMTYTNPDSDIKFYYGYGPRINVGYGKIDQVTGIRSTDRRWNSFGLAGIGYAGIEWFFNSHMSLHAEYIVSAQLNYYRDKNIVKVDGVEAENQEFIQKTFTLSGDGVRFGLSVYF